MRCPKCESTNLYKATSKRYLCKDCKKSSKPEELLPDLANSVTSPADKKLALKFDISTLKDRLGQLRKLSPKQYIAVGIVSILSVGGIVYFVTRDPYLCSAGEREKTLTVLEPLMKDWSNADKLAESTARINLSMPVSRLQDIQKEVENLQIPNCSKPVKTYFTIMASDAIDVYLQFMQNDDYDEVRRITNRRAMISQRTFKELVYIPFVTGERLDPVNIETQKENMIVELEESDKKYAEEMKKRMEELDRELNMPLNP